jgi:hypothetical protein
LIARGGRHWRRCDGTGRGVHTGCSSGTSFVAIKVVVEEIIILWRDVTIVALTLQVIRPPHGFADDDAPTRTFNDHKDCMTFPAYMH